jgi:hypothetical protein
LDIVKSAKELYIPFRSREKYVMKYQEIPLILLEIRELRLF